MHVVREGDIALVFPDAVDNKSTNNAFWMMEVIVSRPPLEQPKLPHPEYVSTIISRILL